MLKSKRILSAMLLLILMCMMLIFSGCSSSYSYGGDVLDAGDSAYVFLNAGQKLELDFAELFGNYVQDIKKVEMVSGNKKIFKVKGNEIRGIDTGMSDAKVTIYTEKSGSITFTVYVYVVNPFKMTEIKTVQDLADMCKNEKGAYILKSNLDLKDFDDWLPIAKYSADGNYVNSFRGMFINPDGYKIKNMTIRSVANRPDSRSNDLGLGLFETLFGAYVDGLILEDICIDTTAVIDRDLNAGGVCGYAVGSVIRNCKVDGLVVSQSSVGGIAGAFSRGIMFNSHFKGAVENTSSAESGGSGGIIGLGYENLWLIDCIAEGAIRGKLYAGGMIGQRSGFNSSFDKTEDYVRNCSFTGELNALYTGEIYGLLRNS